MLIEEVIGPVMVGPSSSHTAGAVYLGRFIYSLAKGVPKSAVVTLYESFAKTGRGHGTDRALVGGMLGYAADDERIRDSFDHAKSQGFDVTFKTSGSMSPHPNYMTAQIVTQDGMPMTVSGCSIGGGKIRITQLDDYKVDIGFDNTLILVEHLDTCGIISAMTGVLAEHGINIGTMSVFRPKKGSKAMLMAETDQKISDAAIEQMKQLPNIYSVFYLTPFAD